MTAVLAIDPGLTGALAVYDGERLKGFDLPTRAQGKRTVIDLVELSDRIHEVYLDWAPDCALVEHVGSMPRQGLSSAFNFGFTAGGIHGLLTAHGFTVHTVTPPIWKFGVGIDADPKADTKARKAKSRARAIELFPDYAHLFARVKDDGRAEAALMAWWFVHKRKQA